MCGIAGALSPALDAATLLARVERMTSTLVHRGPDDHGSTVVELPSGRVALGFRRLSILDLSPRGRQPMRSPESGAVLCYNGEVYNFRELRERLSARPAAALSTGDAAVLLAAWDEWGLGAFDRARGMWAAAVVDPRSDLLVLSRDRLGKKPLYVAAVAGDWIFASEVKALLEWPGFERRLDLDGLSDYLSYRYPLGGASFYVGVEMVEPGCHLRFRSGRLERVRYWEVPSDPPGERPVTADSLAEVRAALHEAVRIRLESDVPLGAYLSGGLDSSIVVREMADQSTGPVRTYSAGFPEQDYNEFPYARSVAELVGADHRELLIEVDRYWEELAATIAVKDAPLSVPNEVPLRLLAREIKRSVTVVLSGEGADETFGGYGRIFRSAEDPARLSPAALAELPAEVRAGLVEAACRKYGGSLPADPVDHFLALYSYVPLADKRQLLGDAFAGWPAERLLRRDTFAALFGRFAGLSAPERFMRVFLQAHLPGLLLRLDASTMAHGVEARVPFVDHRVVELACSLSLPHKLRWRSEADRAAAAGLLGDAISEVHDETKAALREAWRGRLPEAVLTRRKVGFPVPLGRWFAGELGRLAGDLLLDPQSRSRDLWQPETVRAWLAETRPDGENPRGLLLFMLCNVELWMRQYRVTA
jgi:asparagine synthase (glutamine-hydrolysing)